MSLAHLPHEDWVEQTRTMLDSFRRLLGYELIPRDTPRSDAASLFAAPFVVLSHGVQADPVLNYANRTELELWETDLETLLRMPSRLTAEPMHRDDRARLMERTAREGFVDDYRGVRISATGKRFAIEQAIVWNLADDRGDRIGQAATFATWKPLDGRAAPEG